MIPGLGSSSGESESESHSVVSDSLRTHGLYSPWNSLSQNTGAGSVSLLQGNLPNPGVKPRSPALQADSLPAEPQGKPSYGERNGNPLQYSCLEIPERVRHDSATNIDTHTHTQLSD